MCVFPAVPSIFYGLYILLLSILMMAWKYRDFTTNCHLDYSFRTCCFGGCKMNHAALKILSQNYFIFGLYFNYLDVLVWGLFFLPSVFHRIMKLMSMLKSNFFSSTLCCCGKHFLGLIPATVWWQLRVQKLPYHRWGPVPNAVLK